jgi:O-antigen/teichoic acid export membrane protein
VLSGVTAIFIARSLGVATMGSYQFATSFLAFVAMFFEFGLFPPASRLAARSTQEGGRNIFGASVAAFVPIGVAYSITVFALSYGIDSWFHVHVGIAIRLLVPLFLCYPFQFVVIWMSQGMRRLHVLSVTQSCGAVLTLGLIGIYLALARRLTLASSLLLTSSAQLAGEVFAVIWLRPLFVSIRARLREILTEARRWGFQSYVGRVLSVGTYNMDVLMVAALTDSRQVAFYSLAGGIAGVITFPATGIAAALFPRMTSERGLRRSWKVAVWAAGLAGVIVVWSASDAVVRVTLGHAYLPVVPLVLPLALAASIRGVTQLYISYLAANAKGRELRTAGLILTASNLVLNFALIPPFGATGAAWASFFALVANYASHVTFYRRSIREELTPVERPE